MVHGLGEVAGPAQLDDLAHFLVDRLSVGIILIQGQIGDVQAAGEVQSHGVGAGSSQSPGFVQSVLGGVDGGAVAHGA